MTSRTRRERSMNDTMQNELYQPHLINDVYKSVTDWCECAHSRGKKTETRHLKLFATSSFESISMDILDPLFKTASGNQFVVIMTHHNSKFPRTVPTSMTNPVSVISIFLGYWSIPYWTPIYLLTENCTQTMRDLFKNLFILLRLNHLKIMAKEPVLIGRPSGTTERWLRDYAITFLCTSATGIFLCSCSYAHRIPKSTAGLKQKRSASCTRHILPLPHFWPHIKTFHGCWTHETLSSSEQRCFNALWGFERK